MNKKVLYLTQAGLIAALYCVLTLVLAPISFGVFQFRLSEALMLLCAFMPSAIPGVTLGCLLSNLLNPMNLGPIDIFGGSLATLLAAWVTWNIAARFFERGMQRVELTDRKKLWAHPLYYALPLPSIVFNGLIVGVYLTYLLEPGHVTLSLILTNMAVFSVCEAAVVYLLGLPLLYLLLPYRKRLCTEL